MAVVAVSCELFSGEFPANREINRELGVFRDTTLQRTLGKSSGRRQIQVHRQL
jgi:hypothetical protein